MSENNSKLVKCVLPYSGGADSTTILWKLFNSQKYNEIHCISFNYGQRHLVELECAKWNVEYLNNKNTKTKIIYKTIDISFLRDIAPTSCLTNDNVKVPTAKDAENNLKPSSYVPNRNMIMLSIAASYAEAIKALEVFHGAMLDDFGGYWDCKPAFFEGLNKIFEDNPGCQIKFETPLMYMSKADIIKMGLENGVHFEHTWSDYSGGKPINAIRKSVEGVEYIETTYLADVYSANSQLRINAFASLGVIDPLPYKQPEIVDFWKKKGCINIQSSEYSKFYS